MSGENNNRVRSYIVSLIDLLSIIVAFCFSIMTRNGDLENINIHTEYQDALLIILLLYLVISRYYMKVSKDIFKRGFIIEFLTVLRSQTLVLLSWFCYLFITKQGSSYSRFVFVIFFIMGTITIYVARCYLKLFAFIMLKRVGKNGGIFNIYKFRSMYIDAEERKKELMVQNEMHGLMFKMKDDPRITKIGKFIRRTSIDELPQFLNILNGDMSLVGTRPPTVDEFNQYEVKHRRRMSIKPRLTGLWQVSGRNEIDDFDDVVKYNLEYIDNWSVGLDIKLMLKTLAVIVGRTGN
ncbi:Sugar transferase involved in LPS biosynthesis (colanic, teichoic acid) [[Clostridium] fimetarium]|uniref:Sugar transferase involved in LPS biosynthesis (Colanic, teichoic acid) n=1 Tax=[Clostridium] fimetarium TaxID=99656 RepID=A0A1I0RLS2_9FIRM|nr:sugar transferase [[Clostridium] fimetarium]SEW42115.1 Sugar transferase involved in LPS biosynthesis (colanic, teichoic acid) [[Clostridium] fimetarium]